MKKLLSLAVLAVAVVGSAVAQMAIPGEIFAQNPSRFNGRRVTLKNIEIVKTNAHNGSVAVGPVIGSSAAVLQNAPGAVGTPSAPAVAPCRPPRGFSEVSIFFKGEPTYKACFFMADNMKTQLDRELADTNTPAMINFRGDSRMGYVITFYRLGM